MRTIQLIVGHKGFKDPLILSLLTYCKVFKEIQVGFFLIGHMHEDIDACYSHLLKALKTTNTFNIIFVKLRHFRVSNINLV
jgi:hypothetical protein